MHPWLNWIEHLTTDQEVAGSNPAGCTNEMKTHTLKFKQTINSSLNEVYDFFSKPENLSKITPEKLNFTILTPTPIRMKDGQVIDYTIKILGKTIRWKTLITAFEPPYMFVDQQLSGPYSMWHHKHLFKKTSNGIEIEDHICYAMPFGVLGELVNWLWVKKDLEKIFLYRQNVIKKYFKNKGES